MRIEDCKVGMKIKGPRGDIYAITAIGESYILATDDGGEWQLTPSPYTEVPSYPERWINVYAIGIGTAHRERGVCDLYEVIGNRLGVIHLATDGTLTMEAP